ncbi:MAG: response regulator [Deltaproteobacteria bacterium]|nr:response regulator [Deltaproteobacteria bacterium]
MAKEHKYRYFKIAVVDDSRSIAMYITDVLSSLGYSIQTFTDSVEALQKLPENIPDLLLLDIEMPKLDGYELWARLKTLPRFSSLPVIFVSTLADKDVMVKGFALGARDYITKPFHEEELIARVQTHLQLSQFQKQQHEMNRNLKHLVEEQVAEITNAQLGTIKALATLAEYRDEDTGTHLFRVAEYCRTIGDELLAKRLYSATSDFVATVAEASPLHDIGKVAIPDAILLKPEKLTKEEFDTMKTHTVVGAQTLLSVTRSNFHNRYLLIGADIALSHHEKWDGSGYPHGLSGENIPLCGRIMAIADVYDALRSQRCYKPEFTHDKAFQIITEDSGVHFDPVLVKIFVEQNEEFDNIWKRFTD